MRISETLGNSSKMIEFMEISWTCGNEVKMPINDHKDTNN